MSLPERIDRLEELGYDLWWSWTPEARDVFRSLDYPLWRQTAHNPVLMLRLVPRETLERAARDKEWLERYDRAIERLEAVRAAHNTWCQSQCPDLHRKSAEK